ncbi:MAG: SAM-dependent methyltransferase [Chloroflexota bacterium]
MASNEADSHKTAAKSGSLTIVGTGIQLAGQITLAAKAWIEQAEKVLFVVADPLTAVWLQELNPTAEPLHIDKSHLTRRAMYQDFVAQILAAVQEGQRVCAVFYGHPGVLTDPAHMAIAAVRAADYPAKMLPGISADACLFSDLGVDPGRNGCQQFEATDFLIRNRCVDPRSMLILWQIGAIGNRSLNVDEPNREGLAVLAEVLQQWYPPEHEVVVYETAVYATNRPIIERMPLSQLPNGRISKISTLYIPPIAQSPVNKEMMAHLKMTSVG